MKLERNNSNIDWQWNLCTWWAEIVPLSGLSFVDCPSWLVPTAPPYLLSVAKLVNSFPQTLQQLEKQPFGNSSNTDTH